MTRKVSWEATQDGQDLVNIKLLDREKGTCRCSGYVWKSMACPHIQKAGQWIGLTIQNGSDLWLPENGISKVCPYDTRFI